MEPRVRPDRWDGMEPPLFPGRFRGISSSGASPGAGLLPPAFWEEGLGAMAKPGHARSCVRARPCTQPHGHTHGHTQGHMGTHTTHKVT